MAPYSAKNPPSTVTLAFSLLFTLPALSICQSPSRCYESIISFGDSLADTGNLLRLSGPSAFRLPCSRPPYGETFFHHPTGRYSNGRLVIDFIDGKRFVRNSLIILGEIGGNDYNIPLVLGMSPQVLRSLAPAVVEYIGLTLQELIKLGAKTILVPGNFPIGCFPVFLTMSMPDHENFYDPETGCINWLNEISRYHNELLQKELGRIQELHPRISIIYIDYYNALTKIYLSPKEFGFGKRTLSACCGGGGPFNYNKSAFCGFPLSASCGDPSSYVSWDGFHLTEAAYRFLAQGLLGGHYTAPHFTANCSSPSQVAGFYQY